MAQPIVNGINIATQAPLAGAIYHWASTRGVDIGYAYSVGGQFEIWAQVEIAVLIRQMGFVNVVKREEAVFTDNSLHADFAIVDPNYPRHIVELKIEGSSANGADTFVTNLSADIDRLIEKRVKAPLVGIPGISVGISCTAACATKVDNIFLHQGDKPTRVNIPGSTIVIWIFGWIMK